MLSQSGTAALNGAAAAANGGADPYTQTQEVIAKSNPVLLAALPNVRPAMSLNELRNDVAIGNLTPYIISVSVQAKTAAEAAANANVVAQSYISYIGSASSPGGQVPAQLLQSATPSTGSSLRQQYLIYALYALAGAILGALVGVIAALAISRNDRRLRERDEIANSIGVPVLASFPVDRPSDAGKWIRLLEDYKPGALHALQLRKALQTWKPAATEVNFGSDNGRWSVTVLSLSSDSRALALGPQLAIFAASQGISTALVIGPQQEAAATATLRTACAAPPASAGRPRNLRLLVTDGDVEPQPDTALTVVVAVVDSRSPQLPGPIRTTSALLGVSAGVATADQLARVAVNAATSGCEITGILVADPDTADATTGRLPRTGTTPCTQDADPHDRYSDGDQTVTDRDQTAVFSLSGANGEPDRLEDYDDSAAPEVRSADLAPGIVSLGFITAAVRRSGLFLLIMAIVGPIVGMGVYAATPHAYQASASVLLTLGPFENSQTVASDNQAIAETRAVADLAVHALGLQQSVSSFVSSYTVTSVTQRVLNVTASGPSPSQAVLRATAVATAFLKFRANELQTDLNLQLQSLNQQVSQAMQRLNSITAQVTQLSGQVTSSAQQLGKLRAEQTSATNNLGSLQQAVTSQQTTTQPALTAALKGSQVLSVVALPRSKLKSQASYAIFGIIAGLAVGLAIVIIRALVSNRLRQRDDIAYALEAPVKLSVGPLRPRRLRLPGRAARRDQDMKRVIAHLHGAVPRTARRPASLAIVAVDNAPVLARAVAALATSSASQGQKVVAADLSPDAPLARLLGVKGPGTHAVSRGGADFTVIVPDRDDAAPVGPLRAAAAPAAPALAGDAALGADVDVLLALVTLDPALGGDHLATWAASAVVAVTAGQSSAERVHSVGEMVRLAGVRLDSVILIGADKSDETLGQIRSSDEQIGLGVLGR